jgi:hypothetical protein
VGFSPCISHRTRKRGPGSERDWRFVQSSRYRASIEAAPLPLTRRRCRSLRFFDLFALDGHDLRRWLFEERKRVLANLLRRQRDRISFNEIGFRVEVAAVKWRTTNSQIIRRIKTI